MAERQPKARILLVEDESVIGLAESRLLTGAGYEVELAREGEAGLRLALESRFDLVLMDVNLGPGMDGGEAARRIREGGGPPVVFLSSHFEETAVAKTRDSGGYGYIVKGSGDRILLASIRMALELASALRGLRESEERWSSLARTAPDIIVSLGPDGRILFINRAADSPIPAASLGTDLALLILPEDREAFDFSLGRVFGHGVTVRHHLRMPDPNGGLRRYDAYLGPVREGGQVVSATAVIRDVTGENRLAMGEPLDERAKAAEVRAAMAAFDFAPVLELLAAFYDYARVPISIQTLEGKLYSSSGGVRACEEFHMSRAETSAACDESDRRVEALFLEPPSAGYVDYRCINGLRDIALPLVVEGVHWGTLFIGQFLYDEDEVDEAVFVARARRLGWEVEDYLDAIREVPRYSRSHMAGLMSFFASLGRIVTSLAYAAFKERVLTRHSIATEAALGESDRRYRLLAENVGDVIWTLDPSTLRFTYISPSIESLRGLSVEEALAEPFEASMSPESLAKVRSTMTRLMGLLAQGDARAAEAFTDIYEQPFKGGGMKWVEISTKPVLDAAGVLVEIAGVSRDVTARVQTDIELKKALADKDRLYAELQHRVKNSLALIASLLSLEAGSIESDEARAPLEEAQVRVRSVALLYEQLYRTRSVGDIDLGAYLAEVARTVIDSPLSPRGLRLDTECESLRIATDRAVPAGLLLYELVANSMKHAFPGAGAGRIRLSLGQEGGSIRLRLEDDGVGLPDGFALETATGLGSLLISQLAAQLGGSAESGRGIDGAGAGFLVSFPLAAPL